MQPLIAIVGPTASEKSHLAMWLAERLDGEIVSADSVQVYQQLNIGSSKPSAADQAQVPHHMLDMVTPDQPYTAGQYAEQARAALANIAQRGKTSLLCGGSGLYIRALLQQMVCFPSIEPHVANTVTQLIAHKGLDAAYARLQQVDPTLAGRVSPTDHQRIERGLAIWQQSKCTLSEWQSKHPYQPLRNVLVLGIAWPRTVLRARITARVGMMLQKGWVDEMKSLLLQGYDSSLKALQSIGYRQIGQMLAGQLPAAQLEATIALRTGQFAKRQETWLRKQGFGDAQQPCALSPIEGSENAFRLWIKPEQYAAALHAATHFLNKT